jgi:mono/diheme cytochrome c family protein
VKGLNDATALQDNVGTLSLGQRALQIIETNCASCHTSTGGPRNIFNLTDVGHLVQTGLVVPGNPDGSPLLQSIEANRMPKSIPLGGADKLLLRQWILAGANPPSGPVDPQPPGPSPGPPPGPPPGGSLADQAIAVLNSRCIACHGSSPAGRLDKITDPAHVVALSSQPGARPFLKPGDPLGSLIYSEVMADTMPIGGARVPAAEKQILYDWILAGAKPPSTTPPAPPSIPLAPTYQSLNANIFGARCVACHTDGNAKGGVRMNTYAGVRSLTDPADPTDSDLYKVTLDGEMPPGGPRLNSAELAALLQWIESGAPNN